MEPSINWRATAEALSHAVLGANDTSARGAWYCSNANYAKRTRASAAQLTKVLSGTSAEAVSSVVIPASGGDIGNAWAAFPHASLYTLLSSEPVLPSSPRNIHALANNLTGAAALSAVFACNHRGAYFLGIQLKAFAQEWGILPVLLFALSLHGAVVQTVAIPAHRRTVTIIACRRSEHGSSRCHHPRRIHYMQADLHDRARLETLVSEVRRYEGRLTRLQHSSAQVRRVAAAPRRALLIKCAEAAFRSFDASPEGSRARGVQEALSLALLRETDVVLQDTQSAIRWAQLRGWVGTHQAQLVPLGSYVGPEDAIFPNPSDPAWRDGSLTEELRAMRQLWSTSKRWRSLRGLRFGYCHGMRSLPAELLAARRPLGEPPAAGESDRNERASPMYCAALLASRPEVPALADASFGAKLLDRLRRGLQRWAGR